MTRKSSFPLVSALYLCLACGNKPQQHDSIEIHEAQNQITVEHDAKIDQADATVENPDNTTSSKETSSEVPLSREVLTLDTHLETPFATPGKLGYISYTEGNLEIADTQGKLYRYHYQATATPADTWEEVETNFLKDNLSFHKLQITTSINTLWLSSATTLTHQEIKSEHELITMETELSYAIESEEQILAVYRDLFCSTEIEAITVTCIEQSDGGLKMKKLTLPTPGQRPLLVVAQKDQGEYQRFIIGYADKGFELSWHSGQVKIFEVELHNLLQTHMKAIDGEIPQTPRIFVAAALSQAQTLTLPANVIMKIRSQQPVTLEKMKPEAP
ncbi:MAG: hypothetical protein OXT67_00440 [Zetaproteobacteria bacterium]|nr:hypothetical protein [Zetaproteobacteria bacterium]